MTFCDVYVNVVFQDESESSIESIGMFGGGYTDSCMAVLTCCDHPIKNGWMICVPFHFKSLKFHYVHIRIAFFALSIRKMDC